MKKEARQLQRGNRNLLLTFKSGIEHFCQSHTVQFPYVRTIASPRRASQDLVSHGEPFDSSALFPFQGSSQLPKIPHRGLRREGTRFPDETHALGINSSSRRQRHRLMESVRTPSPNCQSCYITKSVMC